MMKSIQTLCATFLCLALSAYNVEAEVPNPGFNSLHIGHSFFRPFAQGMPDYSGAAGIGGHSQSIVFSGGATGAPQALWENASKRAEIQAILDGGDVELFGMTFHGNYASTEGYENWINYALAQNPNTRFFLALPWLPSPQSTAAAAYASSWETAHTGFWHVFVDIIRGLFPGVEIYCLPYGQSAGELRLLFAADNLPAVQNLVGDVADSIYTDTLGHPGNILRDLGRLVWLNAIYDVDLSTYTFGPSYEGADLKAIAQAVMDGHDPDYDAAYHNDIDGDRVGDSLDNCISTPNPDQELAIGYTDCGAACVVAACGPAVCSNQ
ncbi:MAG: thrombospondin type 3 repeat-containing protein [Halioglobus sp.]|nr:thrombospondin type 3 repeat-containing protein [Halioglobus sp.]